MTGSREQRQARIVDSVWQLVRRDGLEAASVRNVAQEAEMSAGSLRHLFPSQSELFVFAMRMVMNRIGSRVGDRPPRIDSVEEAERLLGNFLPLDEDRSAESEVWLAFTARSLVDGALRPLRDEGYDTLRQVCQLVVESLRPRTGDTDPSDVTTETERLYAVVDGLLIHGVMRPDRVPPTLASAVLHRHLVDLHGVPADPDEPRQPAVSVRAGGQLSEEPGGHR